MKRYFVPAITITLLVFAAVWALIPSVEASPAMGKPATKTPTITPAPPVEPPWTLAWSDEFNDASIDTSKWQISNFMSPRNNEKNYYTLEDAYLSGGSLVIRAQQRSYNGAAYTSGQLISRDYVIPGSPVKIEMRVKAMNGQGLHGGFWAFHDDTNPPACTNCVWPPEIDVLEVIGSEPQSIYQTYHAVNSANDGWHPIYNSGIDFTSSYHIVTAVWLPGSVTFYYDGILNHTVANSGIEEIDMKILLDTSIGGNWPGLPDATTVFPNYAYVDYVRVYTGGSTVTVTSGPSPTRTNTPVATATPSNTNLALNKPVTVSSINGTGFDGTKAVDGNMTTYWRSLKRSSLPSEWIIVDLGSSTTISRVELEWWSSGTVYGHATAYTIQVSQDNINWTTVATLTGGDGGNDTLSFAPVAARYVKMDSTAWSNSTERNYLYEFEIYQ